MWCLIVLLAKLVNHGFQLQKGTKKNPTMPWGLIDPTAAAGFQVGPKCQACKKRDGSEGASGGKTVRLRKANLLGGSDF